MIFEFDSGVLLGIVFSIFIVGLAFQFGIIGYDINQSVKEMDSWDCEVNFQLDSNVLLYDKNFLVDSFKISFPCNDVDSNNFLNGISRGF